MIRSTEKRSFRDSIGNAIQSNVFINILLLFFVASVNLFNLVPAALGVPVTLVLIWLIMWLTRSRWAELGLRRPTSISKVVGIGLAIGIASELFVMFLILPFLHKTGAAPLDYSVFSDMKGNIGMFAMYLAVSWLSAGLGEEIIYRGFLMGNVAKLFGDKRMGWVISLLIVSIVFALSHAYQGPTGMTMVGFSALLYGAIYILSGKNLWYTIIAHGTADSFVFLMFFTGMAEQFL